MYPGVEDPSTSASGWLKFHVNTPSDQLEHMAFALLRHEISGQRRLQYIICVNWVAYVYLTTYQSEARSACMRQTASDMKQKYRDNVLAALALIDTTIRPDPVFLQSVLSGVSLVLHSSFRGTKAFFQKYSQVFLGYAGTGRGPQPTVLSTNHTCLSDL